MPSNFDKSEQLIVLKVASSISTVLMAVWMYSRWVVLPKLEAQTKRPTPCVLWHCFRTVLWMAMGTTALVWPVVTLLGNNKQEQVSITSSINFCEVDFETTSVMAEPANTMSNWFAYIPLPWILLQQTNVRCIQVCYGTILLIAVGSTLLHAVLSAVTQGGDEVPMVWYTAATSYCGFVIMMSNGKKRKQRDYTTLLAYAVAASAMMATYIYILNRSNFMVFYGIFNTYAIITIFSLVYIGLVMPLKDTHGAAAAAEFRQQVFLPLGEAAIVFVLVGIWCWVAEMVGCRAAQADDAAPLQRLVWNRILHPCWHFVSGVLAVAVVQALSAAHGFAVQQRGVPKLVYPSTKWYGAVLAPIRVVFGDEDDDKGTAVTKKKRA